LQAAAELDSHKKPEEADLSQHIREMLATMPPVETERDRTKRELLECFGRKNYKAVDHTPDLPEKWPDGKIPKKKERDWER
jgi:hypothetical protein